jgi:hypothetical protein
MEECHVGSARGPPALKIDLLRAHVKKATDWYIQQKAEQEEDEYVESVLALFKFLKLIIDC